MKTIQINLYKFSELSETAKKQAIFNYSISISMQLDEYKIINQLVNAGKIFSSNGYFDPQDFKHTR
jgi:hypothetical protein